MFYKERFVDLKEKDKPVTEVAKLVGLEWKALNDEDKVSFMKQAAEQR